MAMWDLGAVVEAVAEQRSTIAQLLSTHESELQAVARTLSAEVAHCELFDPARPDALSERCEQLERERARLGASLRAAEAAARKRRAAEPRPRDTPAQKRRSRRTGSWPSVTQRSRQNEVQYLIIPSNHFFFQFSILIFFVSFAQKRN